jgi:hypothetical protein
VSYSTEYAASLAAAHATIAAALARLSAAAAASSAHAAAAACAGGPCAGDWEAARAGLRKGVVCDQETYWGRLRAGTEDAPACARSIMQVCLVRGGAEEAARWRSALPRLR